MLKIYQAIPLCFNQKFCDDYHFFTKVKVQIKLGTKTNFQSDVLFIFLISPQVKNQTFQVFLHFKLLF